MVRKQILPFHSDCWNGYFADIFAYIFLCPGTVEVLAYPSLRPQDTLMAHTAGCYCIAIDPVGRCALGLLYLFNDWDSSCVQNDHHFRQKGKRWMSL